MNWKSLVAGSAAGLIAGYCLSTKVNEKMTVSGEKVLENVKQAFKKQGRIDGSWLQMKPEDYQKFAFKTKVYRGGITTNNSGSRKQFEFIADAYTGTVIDVYPI